VPSSDTPGTLTGFFARRGR